MRRLAAACVFSSLLTLSTFAAAPLHKVAGAVAGRYIVLLDDEHPSTGHAESLTRSAGATLVHTYDTVLNGFSIRATEQKAAALTKMPGVAAVWEVPAARANDVQANPPKGLDRIDQRDLPLNNSYTYYSNTTVPTTIYIVDTGVDPRPSELGTRVVANINFWTNDAGTIDPNDYTDGGLPLNDSWHGTPHAVIAAGTQFGVAKAAKIANVRVMRNAADGSWDDIVAGVQWVTQRRYAVPGEKHIANLSIGANWGAPFTGYQPVITALSASINAGVAWIFSAGNNAADGCSHFPAWMASQYSGAMSVGASNPDTDAVFSYSNQGPCVDIYAPSNVVWGDASFGVAQGTSAAAPHVAGVFADRWTSATATSGETEGLVKGAGTPGVLSGIWSNSNNLLLYSLLPRRRACCS
jgi:subtilisin family serine protease